MNQINVALIEDNPADIRLAVETFKEFSLNINLKVINNGEDAVNFCKKIFDINNDFKPNIILLDLNLPRVSGLEILSILKKDDDLKSIPVIILSSSESDRDIVESYKLYANSYISKPIDYDQFEQIIKNIKIYWFDTVKLPGVDYGA